MHMHKMTLSYYLFIFYYVYFYVFGSQSSYPVSTLTCFGCNSRFSFLIIFVFTCLAHDPLICAILTCFVRNSLSLFSSLFQSGLNRFPLWTLRFWFIVCWYCLPLDILVFWMLAIVSPWCFTNCFRCRVLAIMLKHAVSPTP